MKINFATPMLSDSYLSLFNRLPLKLQEYYVDKTYKKYTSQLEGYPGLKTLSPQIHAEVNKRQQHLQSLGISTNTCEQDIINSWLNYHIKPNEYFEYDFINKDASEKSSYLPELERSRILRLMPDWTNKSKTLGNKYSFYEFAKPFFKRKAFHLTPDTNKNEAIGFITEVKDIFCKINSGSMGKGVLKVSNASYKDAEILVNKMLSTCNDWIIEEQIKQADSMNEWNKTSINTIRFPSFLINGKFIPFYPKIRVGRVGEYVDNVANGGLTALINPSTGIITTNSTSYKNTYAKHPDNGKIFLGAQIPYWQELLVYAEAIHRSMSKFSLIGFDFALSKSGCDIVEANSTCQMISTQMLLGRGIKQEFLELCNGII